jgi:hypothetical protein
LVKRDSPFHFIIEDTLKFLPFTIILKEGSPAVEPFGVIVVIMGIGVSPTLIVAFLLQELITKNIKTIILNLIFFI